MIAKYANTFLPRIATFFVLAFSATLLSACFVTSEHPISAQYLTQDNRLIGLWRLQDDRHPVTSAPSDGGLFVLVTASSVTNTYKIQFLSKMGYAEGELTTARLGQNKYLNLTVPPGVFSAKPDANEKNQVEKKELHVMQYDANARRLHLRIFDTDAVIAAINANKLGGDIKSAGKITAFAHLTLSSEEMTPILSSPEAIRLFRDRPITFVRIQN